MQDKQFGEDLNETERNAWLSFKRICKDFLWKHKAANYQDVVQGLLTLYEAMGCNMSWKSTFWGHIWIFSQKISAKWVTNTVKDFTKTLWLWKAVPRQVDLKYVDRLLLDTEEGCTWRQILAKVMLLYILEESFCLFLEHIKYYFAHLNSSVSLNLCLIKKNLYTYLNSA